MPEVSKHDDDLAGWLVQPSPGGIGDLVRYDHSHRRWHVWESPRWGVDVLGSVYELMRDRLQGWLASKDTDSAKGKAFVTLLDQSKKDSVLKSLATFKGIAMRGDEWDKDAWLLGCANGVLDLRTLDFDPSPSSELLITRSTNVAWDDKAECPKFERFIEEIMGSDPALIGYLMHVIGYAMFGWQREQKFWLWVGEGNNGKGTLAKVIAYVLGEYGDSPASELYMKNRNGPSRSDAARADLVKLQGVRWAWMSEPNGGQFNDEMVKAHTGDDPIQARALYSNDFLTFRPTHTIVFLTNNPPRTDDVGVSMRRRVRVIKFLRDFTATMNMGLEDELRAEAPGILKLLATHAYDWYVKQDLDEPEAVTQWSTEYIEDNDPLTAFIADFLVVERGATLLAKGAFDAYTDWCERTNVDPLTSTGFGREFGRKFTRQRVTSGKVYAGVREKTAMEMANARFD